MVVPPGDEENMHHRTFNILPIVKKEFRQLRRDKRALGVLIFIPAFLLILVGYALNFDVKNLSLAVLDYDNSTASRSLVSSLTQSEYLRLKGYLTNEQEIDQALGDESAHVVIVIPTGFSDMLLSGNEAAIQVLIDGANANTASIASAYVNLGVREHANRVLLRWFEQRGRSLALPIKLQPKLWYNPDLRTERFLLPGLFGLILMIVTVVSTSLSIVREKETGTLEQLKTSPLRAAELIVGKVFPYLLISVVAATIILITSALLFDVVVEGSILLLYAAIALFLTAGLAQGLLISTIARTQQVAFLVSVLSSLLPAFLLSGFIFPIDSMPLFLRIISNIQATKFFLVIIRSIMIKGVGFPATWEQFVYLALFVAVLMAISIRRLKKELAR
ncbi:MAG: ABC transporter permease [Ignavibacteria bacterium]|nr:ABC transporter permease [Ignavibacteria bacterium]